MAYKLFDANDKELFNDDLQNKPLWCRDGEKTEETFIRIFGEQLGLIINPEKRSNPYAPDLLNVRTETLGDLKFQSTPFFKAGTLYSIDPTFAVVFNWKDRQRYRTHYPNIEIYYWVNWNAVRFEMGNTRVSVSPLEGVWMTDFAQFNHYLENCHLHNYNQRRDDTLGNAKSSYVCDIRDDIFTQLI